MGGNKRKGKGKASSSSGESVSSKVLHPSLGDFVLVMQEAQIQICVEFVEADLAYDINLNSSMAADDAFNESIQRGIQKYPEMTGIDSQEFLQYPIDGLDKLTLGEWATRCYGAPPTVMITTNQGKGLLAKWKATNATLMEEMKKCSSASEKQLKRVQEVEAEKAQLKEKYEVEKAKASSCEENLAKVLAKLEGLAEAVEQEKAARAEAVAQERAARVLLENELVQESAARAEAVAQERAARVLLETRTSQLEAMVQNQHDEIISLKTTLEVFTGPGPVQP